METSPKFNIESSPMREAYLLLNAHTPLELSNRYTEEDQKLMATAKWDYNNPDLITNKVKELLENIDPINLTGAENEWRNEILWFWYHHAISCAIYRYKDKLTARSCAKKALLWQDSNHPNKITRLFDFLLNDDLVGAEDWAGLINKEPERSTARKLIDGYKRGEY